MKQYLAMTLLTAMSVLRSRLTAVAAALGIGVGSLAILFAGMSLGQDARVAVDLVIAGIVLGTIVIAIIATANIVLAEQDRGTMLIIRSKPIEPSTIILGKYTGLLAALTALYVLIGGLALAILATKLALPWREIGLTLFVSWMEIALVIAVATGCAALTSPLLATILSVGFWFGGKNLGLIQSAADRSGEFVKTIGNIIYHVLPNFGKYNLHETYLTATQLPASYYTHTLLYTIAYTAFLLVMASWILARREW